MLKCTFINFKTKVGIPISYKPHWHKHTERLSYVFDQCKSNWNQLIFCQYRCPGRKLN